MFSCRVLACSCFVLFKKKVYKNCRLLSFLGISSKKFDIILYLLFLNGHKSCFFLKFVLD